MLYVRLSNEDAAKAASTVLEARGVPHRQEWATIEFVPRKGTPALWAFLNWAKEAQVQVEDKNRNPVEIPEEFGEKTPFMAACFEQAGLGDNLIAIRKMAVEMELILDPEFQVDSYASTKECVHWLQYHLKGKQYILREYDSLKTQLEACQASRDESVNELNHIRSILQMSWLPKRLKRQLGPWLDL